jgi:hypothetical protein
MLLDHYNNIKMERIEGVVALDTIALNVALPWFWAVNTKVPASKRLDQFLLIRFLGDWKLTDLGGVF